MLAAQLETHQAERFAWQSPDEWRLASQLTQWASGLAIPTAEVDSEHFLTPRWLATLPHSRMEFFYRALRKQYRVLLDERGQPLGGAGTSMPRIAPNCRRANPSRRPSPLPTR